MKLSFETIEEISFGCREIYKDEEGIHFLRHSSEQTNFLYSLFQVWGDNSRDTAGVVIDFYTNTKNFEFSAPCGCKFELLVNSELIEEIFLSGETRMWKGEINPEGKRIRISLVFPARSRGVLEYINVDDGAEVTPYSYSGKILFLGDSITQGWSCEKNAFSHPFIMSRYFDSELLNQGVGGFHFDVLALNNLEYEPDRVVVAYGTNDFDYFSSMEEFQKIMSSYMERIKEMYGDKKIYVVTPIWFVDSEPTAMGTLDDCRNAIANKAESLGFDVIDGSVIFPADSKYLADGLHPNDEGSRIYAENAIKIIIEKEKNGKI